MVEVTSISCGNIEGAATSSALSSPSPAGAINGPGNTVPSSEIYRMLSIFNPIDVAIASALSFASTVAEASALFLAVFRVP